VSPFKNRYQLLSDVLGVGWWDGLAEFLVRHPIDPHRLPACVYVEEGAAISRTAAA
jgi:hypothetical protein